jgi:hypothetical protein
MARLVPQPGQKTSSQGLSQQRGPDGGRPQHVAADGEAPIPALGDRLPKNSAGCNRLTRLTRPPDARPHRGSILSLWSTSVGHSSDFAAGQGVGPEWRR